MKKFFAGILCLTLLLVALSGCGPVGDKSSSLSVIYGAAALLSLVLLVACRLLARQNGTWFGLLFVSVLVVNIGYTWLSLAGNLAMALWANRLSYLGSVFLPFSMLMSILQVTNTPFRKRLPTALLVLAGAMFLVAASPGILPIYYKEVSFRVVDGVGVLEKVYGPLHPLYLVYLVGYFGAMIGVIIRARVHKTIDYVSHSVILAAAVLVNIGVWLIEQLVSIDFEMLSISYIISELFLLGLHLVMQEQQRLRDIVKKVESVQSYGAEPGAPGVSLENPLEENAPAPEQLAHFMEGMELLTPTEKKVFEAYIARATSKEVMASLSITENTLKYHNKNIYSKLGVSSRRMLLEYHKYASSLKAKLDK